MVKRKVRRQTVLDLAEECEALFTFVQIMTKARCRKAERLRAAIDKGTNSELRQIQRDLKRQIAKARQLVGIRASRKKIVEFHSRIKDAAKDGRSILTLKSFIMSLASNYGPVLEHFDEMPYHSRIEFALTTERDRSGWGNVGISILERDLYKEMCILSNLAIEKGSGDKALRGMDKEVVKVLERATIRATFSYLEAYVNGLIEDHLLRQEKKIKPDNEKSIRELERKKNLRDRIAKYQKIILGVTVAPVNKGNCQELVDFDGKYKDIRDAFTHPSANRGKEEIVIRSSEYEMDTIVDAAISLSLTLQNAIYGDIKGAPWIRERRKNRTFRISLGF